ncbi:hypothetical protein AMTRI_Chr05g69180 [Amborella trichopoda]
MNVLDERTLKRTFFGNYKPHSDLPSIVDKYMQKVHVTWRSSSHIQSYSQRSIRLLNTCSKGTVFAASFKWKRELEKAIKKQITCQYLSKLNWVTFFEASFVSDFFPFQEVFNLLVSFQWFVNNCN